MIQPEHHRVHRIGWLRAAVLGANDGIVSTASLIVGVAAANTGRSSILIAGVAGLVAGAMSMAAGEYVSVSSQADTERADLELEKSELVRNSENALKELAGIYEMRGLDEDLAMQVAKQLTAHNALEAHARDELGISDALAAKPIQAGLASAGTFGVGAALPLVVAWISPLNAVVLATSVSSLICLAVLGALSAIAGGANVWRATARVTFWGAIAMAITAGIGRLFGVAA